MVSLAKAGTYTAWIAVALVAAAARPASAGMFDQFNSDEPARTTMPSRDDVFNEAYSFSDEDAPTFENGTDIVDLDQQPEPGQFAPAAFDEGALLVGSWGWEGTVEGIPAYIETTFYDDGTYESYATTSVIDLYETGTWTLENGMLRADVMDYYPHMLQTPYGPQPVEVEPQYLTELSFVDENTVRTDIGLSYRID